MVKRRSSGPEVTKLFSCFNSAETKIYPAHNCWHFNIYEQDKLLVFELEKTFYSFKARSGDLGLNPTCTELCNENTFTPYSTGPSCSKLMTSLVYNSLTFQT